MFLLLTLLPGAAWAGVPVVLPSGEDPNLWSPYMNLVGFDLHDEAPLRGPHVKFVADGIQWSVVATGLDGGVRVRAVGRPASARDRENLVSIANSLLNPPEWTEPSWDELSTALPGGGDVFEAHPTIPTPPSAPAPLPAPKLPLTPTPVATSAPPQAPPPIALPTTSQPKTAPPEGGNGSAPPESIAAVTPIAPQDLTASPAPPGAPPAAIRRRTATIVDTPLRLAATPPPRAQPWIRAGAGYAGRQGVAAGVGLEFSGGVIIDRSLRIGIEIAGMSPAQVTGLSGKRTSGDIDVGLLLDYVQPRIGLMFGVQGGYGWRVFESEGAPFAAVGTAWFAPVIGWDIPLGKLPLQLEPYGSVRVDTRPIDITVQGNSDPGVRRGVVAWRGGVRVVFQPGRNAKPTVRSASDELASSVSDPRHTMPLRKVIHPNASGH